MFSLPVFTPRLLQPSLRLSKATAENYNYQVWSTRMMILSALVIVLGVALQLSSPGGRPVRSPVLQALVAAPSTECLSSVSTGTAVA